MYENACVCRLLSVIRKKSTARIIRIYHWISISPSLFLDYAEWTTAKCRRKFPLEFEKQTSNWREGIAIMNADNGTWQPTMHPRSSNWYSTTWRVVGNDRTKNSPELPNGNSWLKEIQWKWRTCITTHRKRRWLKSWRQNLNEQQYDDEIVNIRLWLR